MYKMKNNLVLMSSRSLLVEYPYNTKNMPNHAFMPLDLIPKKKLFLFPKTVQDWNQLPPSTATASSLEDFKALLVAG